MEPTRSERPPFPRLNEPATDFEAKTTHDIKTLGDYRGKWLILFSHPADFTPVCTTEFMAFARAPSGLHDRPRHERFFRSLLAASPGCSSTRP